MIRERIKIGYTYALKKTGAIVLVLDIKTVDKAVGGVFRKRSYKETHYICLNQVTGRKITIKDHRLLKELVVETLK